MCNKKKTKEMRLKEAVNHNHDDGKVNGDFGLKSNIATAAASKESS